MQMEIVPSLHNQTEHIQNRAACILSILIGLAMFVLYSTTAAPGIVEMFDDSLEFQLVGPTFGIAHPTGYPLYVLLSGLWSRVLFPFGTWAWRMNLFSAVAGAVTVSVLFLLGSRLTPYRDGRSNLWAGTTAALTFALGPVWWSQATIAEVYTFHLLCIVIILYLAMPLPAKSALVSPADSTLLNRRVTLLAFVVGLSLTHHRTIVLLLPGLLIYLLWVAPELLRQRQSWSGWILALLLPLTLYLFLPLRASQMGNDLNGSHVNTWQGFWDHVLAKAYLGFFADNPLAVARSGFDWLQLFYSQVGVVGLMLAIVGFAWFFQPEKRLVKEWALVVYMLAVYSIFALFYRVSDVEVFLLPAFLAVSLLLGGGVGFLGRVSESVHLIAPILVQGTLAVVLIVAPGWRGPPVDRSAERDDHIYAALMAAIPYPPESQVIGLQGEMTALRYMQQTEGLGVAATLIAVDDVDQRRELLAQSVAADLPTYITRELTGIDREYSFSGAGPLVRVWPRGGSQAEEPAHSLDALLARGSLRLEGYDMDVVSVAGMPVIQLVLYWRPLEPLEAVMKVSLRVQDQDDVQLEDRDGEPLIEDRFPLQNVAKSNTWLPDELIQDIHYMSIPPELISSTRPLDSLQLHVIAYDEATLDEWGSWRIPLPQSAGSVSSSQSSDQSNVIKPEKISS